MFDETYLHFVRHDTKSDRLILMRDEERPLNALGNVFNFLYQGFTRAAVVQNTPDDRRNHREQDILKTRAAPGAPHGRQSDRLAARTDRRS